MACHVSGPYMKKKNVPIDELVTREKSSKCQCRECVHAQISSNHGGMLGVTVGIFNMSVK